MTNNFVFEADVPAKKIHIIREFNAPIEKVWKAFTDPDLLVKWTAPKLWTAEVKKWDFTVGGASSYVMVSPEGQEMWSIQKYTSITPKTNFKLFNAFADKDENPELPGSEWDLNFSEQNGNTKVSVTIYNESLERMEKMIEMGFKEGFTMTLNYLEELLASLSQK